MLFAILSSCSVYTFRMCLPNVCPYTLVFLLLHSYISFHVFAIGNAFLPSTKPFLPSLFVLLAPPLYLSVHCDLILPCTHAINMYTQSLFWQGIYPRIVLQMSSAYHVTFQKTYSIDASICTLQVKTSPKETTFLHVSNDTV